MTTITHNPQLVRDIDAEAYRRRMAARAEGHVALRHRTAASTTPTPCADCGTMTPPRQLINASRDPYPRWLCVGCLSGGAA